MTRPLYRTFIDETGDRGISLKSSPFFCFAAVSIRDDNLSLIDQVLNEVCGASGRKHGTVVHWRKLDHLSRRLATERLAQLPIRIVYVIVPKATLRRTAWMATHHGAFYNFAARLVVERVSWLINDAGGSTVLGFERVRGFAPSETTDYMDLLRSRRDDPNQTINWNAIQPTVRIDVPQRMRGLCAADIAAGALDSAIRPDPSTGLLEPTYLFNLARRVMRKGNPPRVLRLGLKALAPDDSALTTLPWWPGPFPC